jgi:phospholipid-binding lipoprotein MlaA
MQRWKTGRLIVGLACGVLSGSAAAQGADDAYSDYDDVYFDEEDDTGDHGDPWHRMNRAFFSFNEGLDRWILEPVAKGWDFVLPDFAQTSLRNAFDNLQFPVQLVNNLLQAKPQHAGRDVARFLVNTTVGIGGLMDPASLIGLPSSNEDFGQTLGVWGVPKGPYLMLPVLGPSSVRDGFGLAVDTSMNVAGYFIPWYAGASLIAGNTINRRSLVIEELAAERRAALDFYEAVRSAFTQYREAVILDRGDADPGSYGLVSGGRRELRP